MSQRPSKGLIFALCIAAALWLACNIAFSLVLPDMAVGARIYMALVFWLFSALLLWVGVTWGVLGGSVAFLYTEIVLGYSSIEQLVFLVVLSGAVGSYSSLRIRVVYSLAMLGVTVYLGLRSADPWTGAVISTVFLTLAAVSYIVGHFFRRQRDKSVAVERLANVQESEQREQARSLAQRIHENVATDLGLISSTAGDRRDRDQDMDMIHERAQHALGQLRTVVKVMRSGELAGEGHKDEAPNLLDALEHHTRELEAAGISADIAFSGDPRPLREDIHSNVVAILQEAVTNVLKYGSTTSDQSQSDCYINISLGTDDVGIAVENSVNPEGQDDNTGLGVGLEMLQERAERFGAEIHVGPVSPSRWRFELTGHRAW